MKVNFHSTGALDKICSHQGAVWFKKCNANGNGLRSITGGNKFE
jgi:hypothetical protein